MAFSTKISPAWKVKVSWPVALLTLAVLVVAAARIHLLTLPLERDEGEFAYAGQLWRQTIPPYQLLYNMKFPGIYAAYAVCMTLFGETPAGIHFGLLLVDLGSAVLLYRVARRFLRSGGAAAAAAAFFLLSASPVVLGLAAHATHFVVFCALAGLLTLQRARETQRLRLFFCAGLWLALACLMKQPGAMFGLFGLALVLCGRERRARSLLLMCAGGVLPFLLTCLYLWKAGVFPRFWFWTVQYASAHATGRSLDLSWTSLRNFFRFVTWNTDLPLWLWAGVGLLWIWRAKIERCWKLWLLGFLAASVVAVSVSGFFSPHYFVMLLPAVSLLAGLAVAEGMRFFETRGKWAAWPAAVFASMWFMVMQNHSELFFDLSPAEANEVMYYENPFVEAEYVGHILAQKMPPNATLAVLGSEPEIYFYARRHSATGYIYMYDFFESARWGPAMQKEMIHQIEQARPEYIIEVELATSWDLVGTFAPIEDTPIRRWMPGFLKKNYLAQNLATLEKNSKYEERPNASRSSHTLSYLLVFKRK